MELDLPVVNLIEFQVVDQGVMIPLSMFGPEQVYIVFFSIPKRILMAWLAKLIILEIGESDFRRWNLPMNISNCFMGLEADLVDADQI